MLSLRKGSMGILLQEAIHMHIGKHIRSEHMLNLRCTFPSMLSEEKPFLGMFSSIL
jgi:hypothetical protein